MADLLKRTGLALVLGTTTLLSATAAHAGGFAIREQSAEFQGMSFAGAAAGGSGLSSMFWNPATITLHEGMRGDYNGSLIAPHARAENERTSGGIPAGLLGYSADSGNIGKTAFVPATYSSYQINDMFWVGLGVNAPFGMKTENDPLSLGAIYGYKSKIVTIDINPMAGVKLNDYISLGVGLQINYMKGDLNNANLGTEIAHVKGDDWGFGLTAGVLFTPMEGTTIGVGYRSRIKHTLKGSFRVFAPGLGIYLTDDASVKHTLPDMVTFSVRQKVTDNLDLLGTVEWTNWSLFKDFTIVTPTLGSFTTAYNWKDSWFFSVGAEYRFNDVLAFRAGYAYEKSPVPDATRGVRVPDNDRHWVSVGASWIASDWLTLNASYSHLFVKDGNVNIAGFPGLRASYENNVNIVAVSATVNTGKLFFGR